jgi:hypothetical protein
MGPECSGIEDEMPGITRSPKTTHNSISHQAYAAWTRSQRTQAYQAGSPLEIGKMLFTKEDGRWINHTSGGSLDDRRMGDWLYRHGFINGFQSEASNGCAL